MSYNAAIAKVIKILVICIAALALLVLLVYFLGTSSPSQPIKISIGVMSPTNGFAREVGLAHEYWITQILGASKKVVTEGGPIELKIITRSTRSNESEENCGAVARELKKDGVALILGPVRSGCVENVLEQDLEVPVIATLASSTRIKSSGEDGWFFRATGNDRRRMERLWDHIDKTPLKDVEDAWIIINSSSNYGKGLAENIIAFLNPGESTPITVMLCRAGATEDGCTDQSNRETIEKKLREGLDREFPGSNDPSKTAASYRFNYFLLGEPSSLKQSFRAIEDLHTEEIRRVFTVGSTKDLLGIAPAGTIAIGELKLRDTNSNIIHQRLIHALRVSNQQDQPVKFYPSVYQVANNIVPQAIEKALVKIEKEAARDRLSLSFFDIASRVPWLSNSEDPEGSSVDVDTLRVAIKEVLNEGEFDSIEPPDKVEFNDGEMTRMFQFPISELTLAYNRIDRNEGYLGWVEIKAISEKVNFLESPIRVMLTSHNLMKDAVRVYLEDEHGLVLQDKVVPLSQNDQGNVKTVAFHVAFPGEYYITTDADQFPSSVKVSVNVSWYYPTVILFALIAVWFKKQKPRSSQGFWGERYVEGSLIAVIAAFSASYIEYSFFNISPQELNLVSAAIYGLLGGYVGPELVRQKLADNAPLEEESDASKAQNAS